MVDEVLQWTYLHTPLSNEISAPVREAVRRGDVDPLRLYYDEWALPSQSNRGQVLADVGLVFERIAVIERRLADSERPLTSSVEKDLRAYLAGLRNGPYLDRLGLTERAAEMGRLLHSDALPPMDSAQDRLLPLRLLHDVHQVISAVGKLKIILLLFFIVIAYTVISGLWGVLVTDFIQFWIAMVGCIALAVLAVNRLGGLDAIMERMAELYGAEKAAGMVSMIPVAQAGDLDLMPWRHFAVFVLFSWYVAGLTDGGSYLAQRMLAARNERHATLGYLWYAVAHYCVRMWPWLVVGLAA
ncbi:MAG: hypothetical protein GY842_05420, partial [bacterium]|nr:hypothetical protein [bacterium]